MLGKIYFHALSIPLNLFFRVGFWQLLLKIPLNEVAFAQRGFQIPEAQIQDHLERVGRTFVEGYHAALSDDSPLSLAQRLRTIDREWQGFAFEGAAMGLALLDTLTPWKRDRLAEFMAGPGAAHIYMMYVGAGWLLARLPWRLNRYLVQLQQLGRPTFKPQNSAAIDPLLGWLAIDGYGFHEGYFHWPQCIDQKSVPLKLSGYACRVFDQGLGRSLWFVYGADCTQIPLKINTFEPRRQSDLWSGVGLACAYAGGVDQATIGTLKSAAGQYRPCLAQGAAFAAKARDRAGNPATHTDLACQVLCGVDAKVAAAITEQALKSLSSLHREEQPDPKEPAYEIWRRQIQAYFTAQEVKV